MQEFRRKTLYVGAIQLTEENAHEVAMRADGRGRVVTEFNALDDTKKIETVNIMFMEGGKRMSIGDWLVKSDGLSDLQIFPDKEFRETFEDPDA